MESITKFFTESFNITTAVIIVIVIVVAVYIWRQRKDASRAIGSSAASSAQPSADDLLDKLEKSGAVTRQSPSDVGTQ